MRVQDIKNGLQVVFARRVKTGVHNLTPLGICLRIVDHKLVGAEAVIKELAQARHGEAEDRLELPTRHHLAPCCDVVAVLCAKKVGPQQSAQRVIGLQLVACGDGQVGAANQVHTIPMAHQ